MKYKRLTALVILTLAMFILTLQAEDKGDGQRVVPKAKKEINWLRFDDGLAALKADTTGKHMFIDFTAAWCGWCKRMEKEAFIDPTVVSMVNNHFIPVRVWGDSDAMLDIEGYKISEKNFAMSEFRVTGYPVFWFISPEQSKIGPLRGYQTSPNLIKALTWVKDVQYDTTRVATSDKEAEKKKPESEKK